jgi:hypothetical protein
MNKNVRDRMLKLCAQIAVEQDQSTFLRLVEELNRLLGAKDDEVPFDENPGRTQTE